METQRHESGAKVSVRKAAAGRGKDWLSEAYAIFKKAPVMWILLNILVIAVSLGFSQVPILGALVMGVIGTFLKMGLAIGAADVREGKALEFEHLFKAFRSENLNLIGVEVVASLSFLLALAFGVGMLVVITGTAGLSELFNAVTSSVPNPQNAEGAQEALRLLFKFLVPIWAGVSTSLVIAALGVMAVLFAPYLIVFKRVPLMEALTLSFRACSTNFLPLTVYGLISIFLAFCTVVTLGLGMLVLIPVYNIALYCAYLDVFEGG